MRRCFSLFTALMLVAVSAMPASAVYASYYYKAGASLANVRADIGAILTGTTNKATLSADCTQASTVIYAPASPWTVYDASAGTNAVCYTCPTDDPAKPLYMVVDFNTSGYMLTKLYESWNSTAHTGTNLSYGSDVTANSEQIGLSGGGRMEIAATGGGAAFFSYQSSAWGNSGTNGPEFIYSRARWAIWDTVANGYPPVQCYIPGAVASCPRTLGANGSDITGSMAFTTNTFLAGTAPASITTTAPLTSGKSLRHALSSVFFTIPAQAVVVGASKFPFYLTTFNFGSAGDTVSDGTYVYKIWMASTSPHSDIAVLMTTGSSGTWAAQAAMAPSPKFPAAAQVQSGVAFGFNNELAGTATGGSATGVGAMGLMPMLREQ